MISARLDRRRRALASSAFVSLIVHALVGASFALLARAIVPQGNRESISQITVASIERIHPVTPAIRSATRPIVVAPPAPALHEISRESPRAVPEPVRRPATVESTLDRDRERFAREVAALNASDNPHAIATIDPASAGSTMKTYHFAVPASMRGEEHGNGLITPTRSWRDHGLDCYYGRYEFTYPDGAEESGAIAWPFCYQPDLDPFKEPPHPMPFPPPPVGYVLPPDTDLPPIEKDFYDHWAAGGS
ncbi:MAG: hypothetical protein JOY98_09490 [Candidatus Eremiobacteraeota bacterium]|nr:hypothetical protein [Candidatus Eremiobacteraeota bacterium]